MIGLGLATAQPNRRVLVITGDGEMLMGLGSLATIGVQAPGNLALVVLDNERYGETGMQATATAHGVDLAATALACRFRGAAVVRTAGELAAALAAAFGSHESFVERFAQAATSVFGSGWAWLTAEAGRLAIETTPNQDTPWSAGRLPLLGLDLWEHAYYLKYQNRRADYLTAFWNVVNWAEVGRRLKA
jgi:hypothetical protein